MMASSEEKEIWEFERKSFVHWRRPFLPDDPPPFVSRDKQRLNALEQYRLNLQFTFPPDSAWTLHKDAGQTTDGDGWIYSDHFQSRKWSTKQFASPHLCRKRVWKRVAVKQFVAKQASTRSLNDGTAARTECGTLRECIVHEVEVQSASKWKPHRSGWCDDEMAAMPTVSGLDHVASEWMRSRNASAAPSGAWRWCEGWQCIDADGGGNAGGARSAGNAAVELESLRYIQPSMPSENGPSPNGVSPNGATMKGPALTPTPTGSGNVSDYDDVTEDGTYLTISAEVTQTDTELMTEDEEIEDAASPRDGGRSSDSALNLKPKKKKKKKKRIRIRKNAKKLLSKMKSSRSGGGSAASATPSAANAPVTPSGNASGFKVASGGALSPNEERELHELFALNDRGWCYAQRFSRDDAEWRPQNNIIAKCSHRRRTWVRCTVF